MQSLSRPPPHLASIILVHWKHAQNFILWADLMATFWYVIPHVPYMGKEFKTFTAKPVFISFFQLLTHKHTAPTEELSSSSLTYIQQL